MSELSEIQTAIVSIEPATPLEKLAETIGILDNMYNRLKELRTELDAQLMEWIVKNGEFTIGEIRYYISSEKTYKAKSPEVALEVAYVAAAGEVVKVCACLSANAWKPGAFRKLLEEAGTPDKFGEVFETIIKEDVKTGAPLKKLQKLNPNFAK